MERDMASSPDYDAPRTTVVGLEEDPGIAALKADQTAVDAVDVDEPKIPSLDAELIDEELTVAVVPMMEDEFRCSRCFLVHHNSQHVSAPGEPDVCRDCA
jgi:hypothetical protein